MCHLTMILPYILSLTPHKFMASFPLIIIVVFVSSIGNNFITYFKVKGNSFSVLSDL